MGLFRNIKDSIDDKSPMSVNNISVLASAFMGVIMGFVICFVLVYDVTYDGKVDTDLIDAGIFVLMSGGYVTFSGLPKAYIDGKMKTRSWVEGEKINLEAEAEEELRAYRRRRKNPDEEEEKITDEE